MRLDNIVEKRKVDNGQHRMTLEISAEEFNRTYNELNKDIATEIVRNHLYNREDDGRPSNIKIEEQKNDGIIRISADINYLGNDHTDYRSFY